MPHPCKLAAGVLAMLLAVTASAAGRPAGAVTVFAAASLTNALQEACDLFHRRGGARVRLSFAASSTLAKQIEAGAGAHLFVSADEDWMDYLDRRGLLAAGTRRPLLVNRLVLVVPSARPLALDLASSRAWLDQLPSGRIATGDPAHVPAGRYARQALTRLGLWGEVEPRLARADNVRSALVLVERGEAGAGIVYRTDALASRQVAVAGSFPEASHDAIVYPIALLRGEEEGDARGLYAFLRSREALDIFSRHGFTAP